MPAVQYVLLKNSSAFIKSSAPGQPPLRSPLQPSGAEALVALLKATRSSPPPTHRFPSVTELMSAHNASVCHCWKGQ
ncbi:hypothetical protein AOLI_G00121980 [Acnodon oligacanthus]